MEQVSGGENGAKAPVTSTAQRFLRLQLEPPEPPSDTALFLDSLLPLIEWGSDFWSSSDSSDTEEEGSRFGTAADEKGPQSVAMPDSLNSSSATMRCELSDSSYNSGAARQSEGSSKKGYGEEASWVAKVKDKREAGI